MLQELCKLSYVTAKLFTLNSYDRVFFLSMWQLVYSSSQHKLEVHDICCLLTTTH